MSSSSSTSSSSSNDVPKFDNVRSHFSEWLFRFEVYLDAKDQLEVTQQGVQGIPKNRKGDMDPPAIEATKLAYSNQRAKLSKTAFASIVQAVKDEILYTRIPL